MFLKPLLMNTTIFQNRNATFEVCSKGKTIRKNYFSKSKNLREYDILNQMQSLYKPLIYNGWTYDIVKVYEGTEENGILMNIVPGVSMLESKSFSKDYYYYCGIWLGHFHSLSRQNDDVKAFGDFSFSNVFISYSDNIITALDPSGKGMSDKNYYFDILTFFKVAFINSLKKKHEYNKLNVNEFLKGYNRFGNFSFSKDLLTESKEFILKDFKLSVNTRYSKLKAFLSYQALSFHFNYMLSKWLKNYN